MIGAGVVTGALLATAGALIGGELSDPCAEDAIVCIRKEVVLGALIGEVIGVPIGVHLVGRRASFPDEMGTSIGIIAFGALLARMTMGISLLVAVPVQLNVLVGMERDAATRAAAPR